MSQPGISSYMSFSLLSEEKKSKVTDFFNKRLHSDPSETQIKIEIKNEFQEHNTSPISPVLISYYTNVLLKNNPALFPYMKKSDLIAMQEELLLTYYQLCDHYQFHQHEARSQNLDHYLSDIKRCEYLLRNIRLALQQRDLILDESVANNRTLAQFLLSEEHRFQRGKTVYIRKRMGDLNYWRLYWVWTGMMMRSALSMINDSFYHISQTKYVATEYQNIWGYISWLLYYARLLVNVALVLKHTIPCSWWMSEQEMKAVKDMGIAKRLKDQSDARKFELINDCIWGIVNMICHLWWVGAGLPGYLGNIATALLLVADATFTTIRYKEESQAHKKAVQDYNTAISALDDKLRALPENDQSRPVLEKQKTNLQIAYMHCEIEWRYKLRGLNLDRVYSKGLVAAFIILVSCLVPEGTLLSASASTMFSLAGGVMLFTCALMYSIFRGYMEVCKALDHERRLLTKCSEILLSNPTTPEEREGASMRYQLLLNESEFQHQLASYYKLKLGRTIVVEGLFPVFMFTSFTFLPFSFALVVFSMGIFAAIASAHYLDYYHKPESANIVGRPAMNEFFSNQDLQKKTEQERIQKEISANEPKIGFMKWLFHSSEELGEQPSSNNSPGAAHA